MFKRYCSKCFTENITFLCGTLPKRNLFSRLFLACVFRMNFHRIICYGKNRTHIGQ